MTDANDCASDSVILRLSSSKTSVIATKGDEMWMQVVSQLDMLITDGISIDLRRIRGDAYDEKIKCACVCGIVLKPDRSRVHTWIDHKRYSGTINRLQKMIDGKIYEVRMREFTGRYGKIRKLGGLT